MTVDLDDPKMDGYVPLQDFIDQDQDQSSRRIRDMPYGKRKEEIQINVSTLTFANTGATYESPALVVTLTNTGYDTVNIYGHTLQGEFELKSSLPGSIQAGEVVTVQLSFKPTTVGAKVGSIYFDTGSAAGDELVTLQGTGIVSAPEVPPEDLQDFVEQTVQAYGDGRYALDADLNVAEAKLASVESGADVTDAANVAAAGAVMHSDAATTGMAFVVDEDDMASDSPTKVPTQQSVKAYADSGLSIHGSPDKVTPADADEFPLVDSAVSFARKKLTWANIKATLSASLVLRDNLTADRIYYVRTDGNDANTGRVDNAGGAFLTIQKAMDVVAKSLDLRTFNVTIQVRAGVFIGDGRLNGPLVGNGTLTILCDTAAANYDNIQVTGGFYATNGGQFAVRGVKISSSAAGSWSLYASGPGSLITWSHINFGAVTGGGDHMIATDRGTWINDGPYKITGGALNHYHVTEGGHGRVFGQTVPITGTPNFSGQFAGVASGDLVVIGVNYSGTGATGRAYYVHLNGVIRAEAANARLVFPGNVAGVEESGGRIDQAPQFHAHKNAASQVIANGGWVKVTMGTLATQQGADYTAANSSWNPRSGTVAISATVTFSAISALNEICGVSIFKNGAEYKSSLFNSSHLTNPQSKTVTLEEYTTGTDVYEVYARGGNTGNSTVSGAIAWTYWSGRQF